MIRISSFALAALLAGTAALAQETTFERHLKVSGAVRLDLQTDAGGIVVTAGPAGSVHVRGILKPQQGWMGGTSADIEARIHRLAQNPPVRQTGDTVVVGHLDRNELRGISMRLEIVAPSDANVRARADSGGVRVEGVRGPADLETDSGGVEARNIGSEVRAKTDSGGIRIRNVQGPVYAQADSGGIEAFDIAGSIDVQTDSGGIHLSQARPDHIRAKADSGGAHIKLAAGGYNVRASSDSGHVNVSDITVQGRLSKHHVEGKVRGGGPVVDVQVGSGTISID
jgi:hypothetical protein